MKCLESVLKISSHNLSKEEMIEKIKQETILRYTSEIDFDQEFEYTNLESLKNDIETLSGRKVNTIFESESEVFAELDYMIDYEFEEISNIIELRI